MSEIKNNLIEKRCLKLDYIPIKFIYLFCTLYRGLSKIEGTQN
jgi:hypothetical protein